MAEGKLEEQWADYLENVLGRLQLTQVEVSQHKKTFYAGSAIMMALTSKAVNDGDEAAYISLKSELSGFARDVLMELVTRMAEDGGR